MRIKNLLKILSCTVALKEYHFRVLLYSFYRQHFGSSAAHKDVRIGDEVESPWLLRFGLNATTRGVVAGQDEDYIYIFSHIAKGIVKAPRYGVFKTTISSGEFAQAQHLRQEILQLRVA